METVTQIVNKFLHAIDACISVEAQGRAERAVAAAFSSHSATPTKNPKNGFYLYSDPSDGALRARSSKGKITTLATTKKSRRKGPIQLCPVPKCSGRAAPVFGMVCAKHKGVSKAQIKKYREARRAKAKK